MIKAFLTDIEGTITRISFVKEVLFPYAAEKLPEFVRGHSEQPEVAQQIAAVRSELGREDASLDAVIDALLGWIAEDRKVTPLKELQGLVWEKGYRDGDFTGHLYPDAYAFLQAQKEAGKDLYVYSSGSVKAQHLLFEFSDYGDMRPLFSAYFDTKVGQKREASSYRAIAGQLPYLADEILFLSDVVEELDAAHAAGMKTLQLLRDGQASSPAHPFIHDFSEFKEEAL